MTPESGARLTLVAVLRIDRDHPVSDLDRFIALGVPSLDRFLAAGAVEELIVIVPERDVAETARRLAAATRRRFRVVGERELIPQVDASVPGGRKQQLIKLAAAGIVRTEWFITLDADVVAARPLDADFLLPGGRAIWQREDAGMQLEWWQNSARVLRSSTQVAPGQAVFGVTPAILHTASARGLPLRIEQEYPGRHWTQTLAALSGEGWTEYTIYWTYLLDIGAAEALYSPSDRRTYSGEASVWSSEQMATRGTRERLAAAFAVDAPYAFLVFQSRIGRPLDETVTTLRPFIEGRSTVSREERRRWARHARRWRARRMLRSWRNAARRALRRG